MEQCRNKRSNRGNRKVDSILNQLGVAPDDIRLVCMPPIKLGYYKYNELFDGTLTLYDVCRINQYVNIENEITEKLLEKQNVGKIR